MMELVILIYAKKMRLLNETRLLIFSMNAEDGT